MRTIQENRQGQGLVEYALILVLVAVVVVGILAVLGPQIANVFSQVLAPGYCGNCICGTAICN
jgi:pilus assembly protein Flp/PilA